MPGRWREDRRQRWEMRGTLQVGLLDELEQQAQQRGLAGDEAARRKAERDHAYRMHLEPALDALQALLT